MRLLHFSSKAIVLDPRRKYDQEVDSKPNGLWVTTDNEDGWEAWCRNEEWGLEGLKVRHEVLLDETLDILRVEGEDEIKRLTEEYVKDPFGLSLLGSASTMHLDWPRLAGEYDGILVVPYVWRCRLSHECSWYYSWDCASGCVWNLGSTTIKEIADG